jgi:hypothetical protein
VSADSRVRPDASSATSGDETEAEAGVDEEEGKEKDEVVAMVGVEEAAEIGRGVGGRPAVMISTACEGVRCRTSSCL